MDWYFSSNSSQVGPVSERALLELVSNGGITSETLVWHEGLANWLPFGQSSLGNRYATCAASGQLRPHSEMLQYGDSWVLPEHKDQFVLHLQQGGTSPENTPGWGTYQYVDPKKRANFAKGGIIFVAVYFVLMFIGFAVFAIITESQGKEIPGEQELESVGALLGVLGVLLAQIPYMMWLHRASTNAHAIAKTELDQTPGWTVGFNYIPIMSLWKPYVSMKQIWNASQRKPLDSGSQLVGWWWGIWIAGNLLGGVLPFLAIPAIILGWIIITKVTRWQRELAGDA